MELAYKFAGIKDLGELLRLRDLGEATSFQQLEDGAEPSCSRGMVRPPYPR